ncbi:helix-turn-helix domain-containing protein [Levilactobacillus lindianensis]|uniref:helix-turn-helix domain-containing protein n=1 Tax=Levilactobacillus lindianensis TaxID=2486018 RepID=UPI000F73A9AC|nr:helix-turn-helix domain-containing protein [Levilactobacillus lindianensis]
MSRTAKSIKFIRQHYGISQKYLATLLNVSVRTVQHWEQDDYAPSGPAVKLIQLLANHDVIFTALARLEEDDEIMYLEHDDQALTIMGVAFRNEKEYRATLEAIINNMYEGFEPTVDDVKMSQEVYTTGPLSAKEILKRVQARNTVPNK